MPEGIARITIVISPVRPPCGCLSSRVMAIFGPRRGAPRLAPELDDVVLGRVRKQLLTAATPGMAGIRLDQVEQAMTGPGDDWDRRMFRLAVLAPLADSATITGWERRRPRSADPLVLHAWGELYRGRRSGELADPQELVDLCYRAADLVPADPAPWITVLGVLRLLRRPLAEVLPVWREATARDAWSREAHLQMLGYLSPEECGSPGQVLDFVDSMRAAVPPDAPTAGIELIALVERHERTLSTGGLTGLMAGGQWTQPRAAAVLDEAVASWPEPGHLRHAAARADLNLLAYALVRANRAAEAAPVFAAIGGLVTPWPWGLAGDPLDQFADWQQRARL